MRDFRKFCRPSFSKNPGVGDILLKLKCGEVGAVSKEEYEKILNFFNVDSFVGEDSPNSSGNMVVTNKETGKLAVFSTSDYESIKDDFELVEIIGSKNIDPINNKEYVDLGLPSGTLWSTKNVGASSITDIGNYYSWGELTPTNDGDWEDYDFAGEGSYVVTKYNSTDNITILLPEDDISRVILGGGWGIATYELVVELNENTIGEFVTNYQNSGVNGLLLTSNINGNTIFFPADGYITDSAYVQLDSYTTRYWTGNVSVGNESNARSYYFNSSSDSLDTTHSWTRSWGFLLRPTVIPSTYTNLSLVGDIICHSTILNLDCAFSYNDWLTLDNDWEFKGIYGVNTYTKSNTIVGDIVIKSNNTITFINPSNWSNVSNNWEAIGIVGIESRNTPDSKVRILSLDYMDYNNPTTGNSGTGIYMYWGANGDISGLSNKNLVPCMSTSDNTALTDSILRAAGYSRIPTDYFNIEASAIEGYKYTTISDGLYHPSMYLEDGSINPDAIVTLFMIPGTSTLSNINNASADFDGLNNTSKIMSLCTVDTPVNSYDSGNYPAAQCCSLYNKGNLLWYLPASGELACIIANFNKINNSRVAVGFNNYNYSSYYYWSSTIHSLSGARYVSGGSGSCDGNARHGSYTYGRVLAVSAF